MIRQEITTRRYNRHGRKNVQLSEDTGIKFQIEIHSAPVWVKVWYLDPEIFNTAPMFFLSTDVPENDHISKTICHKLYDANESTKLAQYILLGKGGANCWMK
jgi:starch phosphorylase